MFKKRTISLMIRGEADSDMQATLYKREGQVYVHQQRWRRKSEEEGRIVVEEVVEEEGFLWDFCILCFNHCTRTRRL